MRSRRTRELVDALIAVAAIVVGFCIVAVLQDRMETLKSQYIDFGELLWVPDWKIPHILALGDDDTAADLLWVRSTFYVGAYHGHHGHHHEGHDGHEGHHSQYGLHQDGHDGHNHERERGAHDAESEPAPPDSVDFMEVDLGKIPFIRNSLKGHLGAQEAVHMYHLFDVVTDLDPLFATPYYQGAMYLLLMAGRWREAQNLLDKGARERPDRWEMPYFKGFVNLFYVNDKTAAVKQIRTAAAKRGAPAFVIRLAAALQYGFGGVDTALEFLRSLAEVTEDEQLKGQIEEIILKYKQKQRISRQG